MVVGGKTIEKLLEGHGGFIRRAEEAERYFANQNDIKRSGAGAPAARNSPESPLRTADNRISHNWHGLLVTQKVSYLLTYPPAFDLGNQADNDRVADALGDSFAQTAAALGVDASNTGVGWLHYWTGPDGTFRYHTVDPKQIVPVFSDRLDGGLVGVLRCYTQLDPETGETRQISELWDDTRVRFYKRTAYGGYTCFEYPEIGRELMHAAGAVPFIPFWNNAQHTTDLILYKDLIDAYDKVVSGFANDMEDVQEVVFVLKNYGGQDRTEFLDDLKRRKIIKVEGDGGVDTIRAEIPHEARSAFLDRTRRQIFISGMGVDPDPERFGNASGVSLKFLYSLLELKAALMETQFRSGFAELVRAVCRHEGLAQPRRIVQTWTRNAIQNDLETAQIAQQSVGVISEKTILKNHPWVEDAEAEQKQLEDERTRDTAAYSFPVKGGEPPDDQP